MGVKKKLIELLTTLIFVRDGVDPSEAIADFLIDNGVTVQQWIPVSERLPEHCVSVLAYNGYNRFMDFYDEGFECWCSEIAEVPIRVTHWMPLPELPKKGGQA